MSVATLFSVSNVLNAQPNSSVSSAADSAGGAISAPPAAAAAGSGSSSSTANEGNAAASLVKVGLSVDNVRNLGRGKASSFLRVVETQRASADVTSATKFLKAVNDAGSNGTALIENVVKLVDAGVKVSSVANITEAVSKGNTDITKINNITAVIVSQVTLSDATSADTFAKTIGDGLKANTAEVVSLTNNMSSLVTSGATVNNLANLAAGIAAGNTTVTKITNTLTVTVQQVTTYGITSANASLKVYGDGAKSGDTNVLAGITNISNAIIAKVSAITLASLSNQLGAGTITSAYLASLTTTTLISNAATASSDALFLALTTTAAKNKYSALTDAQKTVLKALYSGSNLTAAEITSQLDNSVLMENLPSILTTSGISNALLAEAAKVGNIILTDKTISASATLKSTDTNVLSYAEAFSSSYNKALVSLIATYSSNSATGDLINAFAPSTVSSTSTIASLFPSNGTNASLLGFDNWKDTKMKVKNGTGYETLSFTLSQGEAYLARDITVVGGSGVEFNVTETNLSGAGATKSATGGSEARVFGIVAVDDMTVSGKVTFKNTNTNAANTQNVLVIGAADELTIADGSEIINQGRILAIGGGKVIGTDGATLKNVSLQSSGSILIGSKDTIKMTNPKFTTSSTDADLIMYAKNEINIAGGTNQMFNGFGAGSEIYMEAITVNLTNVNFPKDSVVKLFSRDGGTALGNNGTDTGGRYPNFGTTTVGRVNFVSGVKYDSQPLTDKTTFDTNSKGNVIIGKITK